MNECKLLQPGDIELDELDDMEAALKRTKLGLKLALKEVETSRTKAVAAAEGEEVAAAERDAAVAGAYTRPPLSST